MQASFKPEVEQSLAAAPIPYSGFCERIDEYKK